MAKEYKPPAYHNEESQDWMLNWPGANEIEKKTVTQSNFGPPKFDECRTKGKRQELLEKFFWQQAVERELQRLEKPNVVEEYNTIYGKDFSVSDFRPRLDKIHEGDEQYAPYPLYSDTPYTFWEQNRDQIQGVTVSPATRQSFKRTSFFTKPLDEVLDEPHTSKY